MFYIKNKKKYFLGLALLFFNFSAFSMETIDIAVAINNLLPNIKDMAISEYKNNEPLADSVIETILNKELQKLKEFLVEENYSILNINDFVEEFIVVANALKKRIKTEFAINGYISQSEFDRMFSPIDSANLLSFPFETILIYILYYIEEGKVFSDYECYNFYQALKTSKLLKSEQESLFKALQKIKR